MRLEMKQMIQQLQEKDGQTAKMKKVGRVALSSPPLRVTPFCLPSQDYERMPKGVNRNSYTVRILEIVKNVKKQRVDINSILRDIRDVQVRSTRDVVVDCLSLNPFAKHTERDQHVRTNIKTKLRGC